MARLSDAVSCALAVALPVLLAGELRPVADAFRDSQGRLDLAGLARVILQAPPFDGADRVTVLLLGADKRAGDTGRSDTLLVLFLNPQTHRAALLGIPRDLRVSVPGHGRTKINHSYAYGGPQLTRRTVEGFLGVSVDHYAVVFFDGFVHATDAVGGVRIEVPDVEGKGRGMNYDDNAGNLHVHLKPGMQRLNGKQALGFVRYRKSNTRGLGDGDVGRSGRQQAFLRAAAEQHLRAAGLPGLLAAVKLVGGNVETDMSAGELTDLARALKACGGASLASHTLPLADSGWHGQGAYYARADEAALRKTLASIDRHLRSGGAARATVKVLNACGVAGQAADASRRLTRAGFASAGTGNAAGPRLDRTVIEHRPGLEQAARRAARALGCGKVRAATEGDGPDLRVLVGKDYKPKPR